MRFEEIEYNAEQKRIFEDLARSVLHICVLKHRKVSDPGHLAKAAAIEGMRTFDRRVLDDYRKRNPDADFSQLWESSFIEGEEPVGKRIEIDRFFGDGYDVESGNVKLFRYGDDFKSRGNVPSSLGSGFVYALYDPPYGFTPPDNQGGTPWSKENSRLLEEAQTRFLKRILKEFAISGSAKPYEQVIYSWSDNWSNFFEAGKEWWGTFFWTILHLERREVTVIAASSTD